METELYICGEYEDLHVHLTLVCYMVHHLHTLEHHVRCDVEYWQFYFQHACASSKHLVMVDGVRQASRCSFQGCGLGTKSSVKC